MSSVSNSAMPQPQRAGIVEKKQYAINLSRTNGLKYGVRYAVKSEHSGILELENFEKVFDVDDFKIMQMSSTIFYLVVEYVKDYCDIPIFKCYSVNDGVLSGYALYNPVNKERYGSFEVGSPSKFATIEDAVDNYMRGGKDWRGLKIVDGVTFIVLNNAKLMQRCDEPLVREQIDALEEAQYDEPDVESDFSDLFSGLDMF